MAILLFVLLAWSLAVHGLFSRLPPRTWTVQIERQSNVPENPKPWSESHGLHRRQEAESDAFTPCGDEQNRCSKLGHPVGFRKCLVICQIDNWPLL